MNNFQRTANWLAACGKEPSASNLSLQIGCHLEEVAEFMSTLNGFSDSVDKLINDSVRNVHSLALLLKTGQSRLQIIPGQEENCLDAICDMEVTGNGVAYFAGFNKPGADEAVLASNEAKLVDGKPVILPGGKIGKPEGWAAPDLTPFLEGGPTPSDHAYTAMETTVENMVAALKKIASGEAGAELARDVLQTYGVVVF